jgi:non-ribosomal peptide synthetase component F
MLEEMIHYRAGIASSLGRFRHGQTAEPCVVGDELLRHPLHRRFETHAQLNPGAVAVKFDRTQMTYGELDHQADGLATLLQQRGVGPRRLCGLCLDRPIAIVRAILAVWKAGGAYIPLNAEMPAERVAKALDAAQTRTVITEPRLSQKFAATDAQLILCGEHLADVPSSWPKECPTEANEAAHAMCVFSSTGRSRVVVCPHSDVRERLQRMQGISPIREGDSVLRSANCSLDRFVWELLWPLLHGARLVIPRPGKESDVEYMRHLVSKERITVMHVVPPLWPAR